MDPLDDQDQQLEQLRPQGEAFADIPADGAAPSEGIDGIGGIAAPSPHAHGAPVADLVIPNHTPKADGAALDSAIESRGHRDAVADFQDAGALFRAAWGGDKSQNGDHTRRTRDDSVNDVFKRRALEDQDRALAKQQHDAALAEALGRGDSPESIKIKDAFGGTSVGAALRSRMGADAWMKLPGHAIPGAKEQLSSETDLMKAGLRAAGAAKDNGGDLETLVNLNGGRGSEQGDLVYRNFQHASPQTIRGEIASNRSQPFQASQNELGRQNTLNAARIQAGTKLAETTQGNVGDLGAALKDYGGAKAAMSTIDAALTAHPKGDIPGIGPIDNARESRFWGFLSTPEGSKVNKAAGQLQLAYRNLVTGSAASEQEDKRIAAAGIDPSNEKTFRQGYELMKARYDDLLRRTFAKDPRAAQRFIAENPSYGIAGDTRYDPATSKRATASYDAQSPLRDIQPALVTGPEAPASPAGPPSASAGGINGAPPLPTGAPVREPGGNPAPTAKTVRVLAPDGKVRLIPEALVQQALAAGGKLAQ